MRLLDKFRYRPDIDGLRAVAVLVVVLYHAGFGCPGGYIGVDVFFVISGFLITSLIWRELENKTFDFGAFWERRARRIVPALIVVTIATLIAGWFLLLPVDFKSLGRASASQAVFAANIHYWHDSDYFATASVEKPLLHTWSLAVEEQFYLVVPFLLWGIFRSTRLRSRAGVLALITTGLVLSFLISIYAVSRHPTAAFYLLPTRAWELLFGTLIAFLPTASVLVRRRSLREFIALAGLALILIPVFYYTTQTPFPGLAALPVCLGTALLIWANGLGQTMVGKALSTRPVVFLGLISYSLYLWHWPLLAFSKYAAIAPLSGGYRAGMLSLGLVLAILSWKYVETPFRVRKLGASRKSMFAFAATGLAVVFGAGLVCMKMQGFPQRFPLRAQILANARFDRAYVNELTIDEARDGNFIPIGDMNPSLRPTVMVWGDSHAMAVLPAIDILLKEKGLAGRAATHFATAPVLDRSMLVDFGRIPEAVDYNNAVFTYIQTQKFSDVILIGHWEAYREEHGHNTETFASSLLATVRRISAAGSRPWVLLDVPTQPFNVPKALSIPLYVNVDIASICARPTTLNELEADDPKIISKIVAAGGRVLDPKPRFLDPTGKRYSILTNGIPLYCDDNHLSTQGAKLILLPFLRDSWILAK